MVFRCGGNGGLGAHRMVLPVRMRIHWGMGLFCFCFLPRIFFVLKVFWDGCCSEGEVWGRGSGQCLLVWGLPGQTLNSISSSRSPPSFAPCKRGGASHHLAPYHLVCF